MNYLKINGKTIMQVNSQYWLYEDIKRYFMERKLEFFIMKMDEATYCFIKADYPQDTLELLMMGKSTNMFSYSDYLIIKIKDSDGFDKYLEERDYMMKVFSKKQDFEKFETESFLRWYSLADNSGPVKILDLTELERIIKVSAKNKKNIEYFK